MSKSGPFGLGLLAIVPLWSLALATAPLDRTPAPATKGPAAPRGMDAVAPPARVSGGAVPPVPISAPASPFGGQASVAASAPAVLAALTAGATVVDKPALQRTPNTGTVLAYAPGMPLATDAPLARLGAPTPSPLSAVPPQDGDGDGLAARPEDLISVDLTGVRPALALYEKHDFPAGDRIAQSLTNNVARAAVEYVALRTNYRSLGYDRLMNFRAAQADWPGASWLDKRGEELLYSDGLPSKKIQARFAERAPVTIQGKLALIRALLEAGERGKAVAILRDGWRDGDFSADFERTVQQEFGALLTLDDYKFRASRSLFKENTGNGLRLAALAGAEYLAIARARAAVIDEAPNADALYQALPPAARNDPGMVFNRVQHLRRADRLGEAADLMLAAPRDPATLVNPDEWWIERRLIARALLDAGDAPHAYLVAQGHGAATSAMKVEAEFHAGWIALRFLDDAATASYHFAQAAAAADTPMSLSRAHYWQGRAAEAKGDAVRATAFYEIAAAHGTFYYGQLAQNRLGRSTIALRGPPPAAQGDARDMSVRVIELLFAAGEDGHATTLAYEAAQKLTAEPQLAALAMVVARQKDARLMLGIGKVATQRGLPFDAMAFPTFGVPAFQPLENSAEKAMVYSIARQESAFQTDAVSKAGARGLMQMLVSTAQRTAQHKGVAFDASRLISDPAFNAQLGAAHLGELLAEQNGSYILTFAAYNAGGKRVKEWIAAHGDPRQASVDPVDWVERIPITETRNYVQRIVENMQIYRYRLGEQSTLLIDADLRRARHGG